MGADNAVLDGISLMSSLLANGQLLVHKSCTHLVGQLQSYAWDEKAAAHGEDKPVKKDDHAVDGGRYGLMTTRGTWRNLILPSEPPKSYEDHFGVAM